MRHRRGVGLRDPVRHSLRVGMGAMLLAATGCWWLWPSPAGAAVVPIERTTPWWQLLIPLDYNTRLVMLGALVLGLASGVIGTFTLLRRRALAGDAASHATLPGIALAFIVMTAFGGDGKYLPGLLAGALLSGLAGMGSILAIRHATRLKEDVALGVVLSVYFGLGMALLGVVQKMRAGHAAGLESFIYGKTASMLASDAWLITLMAGLILAVCLVMFKELALLCFDQEYAASRGYPVRRLDALLMFLITLAVVTGLQAVGLILMIALLIIPPAAARFWTDDLKRMICIAALIGALSGVLGSAISASVSRVPAGAVIVVAAGGFFMISLLFGTARGLCYRYVNAHQLRWKTGQQHLLRLLHEWNEREGSRGMPFGQLLASKSWSERHLRRIIRAAMRDSLVRPLSGEVVTLTSTGMQKARQVVRNHRLWEVYLVHYAHVATHHVDRNADRIEHVLGDELVAELEELISGGRADQAVPPSIHPLNSEGEART